MPLDELRRIQENIAAQSAAEIAARHGIEPKRARLLPSGAAIIAAICATARGTDGDRV